MRTRLTALCWLITAVFFLKGTARARIVAVAEYSRLSTPPLERPLIFESDFLKVVWVHPEPEKHIYLTPYLQTVPLNEPLIRETGIKSVAAVWIHPEPRLRVRLLITAPVETPALEFPWIEESDKETISWVHPEPKLEAKLPYFHLRETPAVKEPVIAESKMTVGKTKGKKPPVLTPLEIGRGLKIVKGATRFSYVKKGFSMIRTRVINFSDVTYSSLKLNILIIDRRNRKVSFSEDNMFIDSFAAKSEKEITVIIHQDLSKIKRVSLSYGTSFRSDMLASDDQDDYNNEIKYDSP
ncbi:MAG: hypothetical protein ACE5GM_07780 [bacterium]